MKTFTTKRGPALASFVLAFMTFLVATAVALVQIIPGLVFALAGTAILLLGLNHLHSKVSFDGTSVTFYRGAWGNIRQTITPKMITSHVRGRAASIGIRLLAEDGTQIYIPLSIWKDIDGVRCELSRLARVHHIKLDENTTRRLDVDNLKGYY